MTSIKDEIDKKAFLEAMGRVKLRVDSQRDEQDNLNNFVQIIDFTTLSASNSNIIYGRNGTGKTHILKAFHQYCTSNFEKSKIFPVYIDFRDLDLGPFLPNIALDDLILRFYRNFFYKIIDTLEDFSNEVITLSLLEKFFGGKSANRKREIDEKIDALNSLLKLEVVEEKMKEYIRKIEIDHENSSQLNSKAGISGKFSASKPEVTIEAGLGASGGTIKKEKETIELIYGGLAVINYDLIRNELESLIQLCGAESIIILIDEWSSLVTNIQPIVAEMIRKTLAASDKIFLKIAAIEYFTKTSSIVEPPHRIGFQLGIDIFQLIDLDYLLNFDAHSQEVSYFLTLVAFRHAVEELPILNKLGITEFQDYLCNEIFETPDAYLEVVRASEGNPRDFLSILLSCCNYSKLFIERKLSLRQTIGLAIEHFTENKVPEIKNNPTASNLYDKLFQKVVKNGKKQFLLSRKKAENHKILRELWNYRFIHIVNSNYTLIDDEGIPQDYTIYSMDYGKLLFLKASQRGEKAVITILGNSDLFIKSLKATLVFPSFPNGLLLSAIKGLKMPLGIEIAKREKPFESINLQDIDTLIKDYIFDDLL